jgi:hypothetical protein
VKEDRGADSQSYSPEFANLDSQRVLSARECQGGIRAWRIVGADDRRSCGRRRIAGRPSATTAIGQCPCAARETAVDPMSNPVNPPGLGSRGQSSAHAPDSWISAATGFHSRAATSTVSPGISVRTAVRASASRSHPGSAIASLTVRADDVRQTRMWHGVHVDQAQGQPPPRCADSRVDCGDRTVDTRDHRYSFPACGDLGTSRCQRPRCGPRWWPSESPHPSGVVQVFLGARPRFRAGRMRNDSPR